jgi:hypothetical protein
MKKIAILLVAFVAFISCDKHETDSWNEQQNGIAFATLSSEVVIPEATGETLAEIGVEVTSKSSEVRVIPVSYVVENTDLPESNFSVGTITIPADSYNGVLTVDFNNTDLVDLTTYVLAVKIDESSDYVISKNDGDVTKFNVFKQVTCNDLELSITFDSYGSENSWDIVDESGTIIESGGTYNDGTPGLTIVESFNLPDGCYTFTFYDSFGDGLFDGVTEGSYTLSCSIINHASGEGDFGASDSTEFCVNQL